MRNSERVGLAAIMARARAQSFPRRPKRFSRVVVPEDLRNSDGSSGTAGVQLFPL